MTFVPPRRAWRAYRGLTQAKLAEMAGITQAGVNRLERRRNGKAPAGRPATRAALAEALDAPAWSLERQG